MLQIQRALYIWEGSINKFMVDDKGLMALCVFGEQGMIDLVKEEKKTQVFFPFYFIFIFTLRSYSCRSLFLLYHRHVYHHHHLLYVVPLRVAAPVPR